MKRLSLDFDNHCLCIMMPGQEGTQIIPELKKEDFERFKREYLTRFIKTYRVKGTNKKELKRSVYDHPQLTDEQKNIFWKLVLLG